MPHKRLTPEERRAWKRAYQARYMPGYRAKKRAEKLNAVPPPEERKQSILEEDFDGEGG
jgi:hypothetical protein